MNQDFLAYQKKPTPIARKVAPHYPWEELRTVTEPDPTPKLRPLIKTEVVYDDEDAEPAVTTKEIPYTVTELAKLQEKNIVGRLRKLRLNMCGGSP